jgi:hypothetical protein
MTIPEEEVEAANGRWYYAQLQSSPHECAIWAVKEIAQLRQALAAAKVRGARDQKDAWNAAIDAATDAIRALKETGHG